MGTTGDKGKSKKKKYYSEWLNTVTGCSDSKIFGNISFDKADCKEINLSTVFYSNPQNVHIKHISPHNLNEKT